jgi:hypothetical protein
MAEQSSTHGSQEAERERMPVVQPFSFFHFYFIGTPSLWDGTTHIQGRSSHIHTHTHTYTHTHTHTHTLTHTLR